MTVIDPVLKVRLAEIAEEAAERACHKTLIAIGIDPADPLKAQKDFALMREVGEFATSAEFRKDIEHTRRWRLAMESVQSKGVTVAIGILITGIMAACWLGLQDMVGKH
jgi:hypothetical protein